MGVPLRRARGADLSHLRCSCSSAHRILQSGEHGRSEPLGITVVALRRYSANWRVPLRKVTIGVSTPDTTFLMYADSEKEKDDWIGAIGRAIVRCSSTYTNEDGMDDEERDSDESN